MRNKVLVEAALLATAVIGLGIGIARGAKSDPNSRPGHAPAAAGAAFTGKAQTLFAVVNPNATLARGYGAVKAVHVATGDYEVDFGRRLLKCVFTATLGSSGSAPVGYAGVVGRNNVKAGVYVHMFNSAGTVTDAGFHLIVACPPA